jgi:4-amino-4-deoxy-L-arabinose transferase-like glycosyltransferase
MKATRAFADPRKDAAHLRPTRSAARWSIWLNALIAVLLLAAALVVCLHSLGAQPLWLDEGWTWAIVTSGSFGSLIRDLFRPSQAYPLFNLLLKPVTLVSDSEWALRLPAALIGAFAVPALFALGRELRGPVLGLGSALLLLVSQFALRQAQDTKAYSLMLLAAILLAWALARALRRGTRRDWLLAAAFAMASLFVHRLLIFTVLGGVVAWALSSRHPRRYWVLLGVGVAGVLVVAGLAWAQDLVRAGAQFPRVDPVRAAWRTFVQFSTGLWIYELQLEWLIPFMLLSLGGAVRLLLDLRWHRHVRSVLIIVSLLAVPALLFAGILLLRPFYVTRYWTALLPFYLLTLGWNLPELHTPRRWTSNGVWSVAAVALWCWAFLASIQSLYQYPAGLFSGATVKEDYRSAMSYLAEHVQPSDLVVVHPDYIQFMYDYYGSRAGHQLPPPRVYPHIGRVPEYTQEVFQAEVATDLATQTRAWLLIGPPHASTVDPPRDGADLGWVGSTFQQVNVDGWQQCKETPYRRFLDVRVYCIERVE